MSSVLSFVKIGINSLLRKLGYQIVPYQPESLVLPIDFEESDKTLWQVVRPYTMTHPEELYSLVRSLEYIVSAGIPGDLVECGVWKGGSSMAMALTLMRLGDTSRHLYLYDTFDTGWPVGGADDVSLDGITAHEFWLRALAQGQTTDTLFAKYDHVAQVMKATGYPADKVHMIKGKVEDTIPSEMPERIAVLRLDTDWYDSTRHEFVHLYPALSPGGVLMIDDYAYFKGSRKATDEYFVEQDIHILLHRVNGSGYRIGLKPGRP